MKTIKVKLSSKNLKALEEKMKELKKNIKTANDKIIKDLADYGYKEIQRNYSSSPYTDGNEDSKPFKRKTKTGYKIGAKGSQVLYREFGTGTEGLNQPHPMKETFNLKGYNTGKSIRKASEGISMKTGIPVGEMYWTYKDKSGEIVYTQGIPAGKEVFNASLSVRRKINEIMEKRVSELLSKL